LMASTLSDNVNTLRDIFMTDWLTKQCRFSLFKALNFTHLLWTYLLHYESNVSNDRKRKKHKTGNEDINDLCWDWVQDAIRRRINVTGPIYYIYYII
jgi:hypothetical protein